MAFCSRPAAISLLLRAVLLALLTAKVSALAAQQPVVIRVDAPERGVMTRMSTDGTSHWPLWTPEGGRLTFRSGMPGPFTISYCPKTRSP